MLKVCCDSTDEVLRETSILTHHSAQPAAHGRCDPEIQDFLGAYGIRLGWMPVFTGMTAKYE